MAKRAVLIGCNYPGTNGELLGCVNDVFRMKALYAECYGFEDFTILVDNDDAYTQPTGEGIKDALREAVAKTQSGDILLMHFSGHGVQVPSDDPFESDQLDEALVPTDLNLILDDDLREIFIQLPPESYFTCVCDCCHSGGMLDHEEIQITGEKAPISHLSFDMKAFFSMFGVMDRSQAIPGFKNRGLPTSTYLNMIKEKSGLEVDSINIRNILNTVFGKAASVRVVKYINELQNLIGSASSKDFYTKMTNLFASLTKGTHNAGGAPKLASLKAGHKPPVEAQLSQDAGVLITGCMSQETSADACPNADPKKAYGAMSHAIQTVVRKHYETDPDSVLTNRDVVLAIRDVLSKGNFDQNPCLECSQSNADRAFVTGATF